MTHISSRTESAHLKSALKAGLSAKAASVYVTLLENGMAMVPKNIIRDSGLHRQYVYDALAELKQKKLVVSEGRGRIVRYIATSPDRLAREAEKTRIDVLDGVQSLLRLYDSSPAGIVEIARGGRAAVDLEFKMLRDAKYGDFLEIIGGTSINFGKLFGDRRDEYDIESSKKLRLRYIGAPGDIVDRLESKWQFRSESRILKGIEIENTANICIRPESVTFNIYEPEIVWVKVNSPVAVASFQTIFEVLWKNSEKPTIAVSAAKAGKAALRARDDSRGN